MPFKSRPETHGWTPNLIFAQKHSIDQQAISAADQTTSGTFSQMTPTNGP